MRYMIRRSVVRLIGPIWQPGFGCCAQEKTLSNYDLDNIKGYGEVIGHPGINRESVEYWLTMNSGDFRAVTDFSASIEDGAQSIEIPWNNEESEYKFSDAMYPAED